MTNFIANIITKSPTLPTKANQATVAGGVWTLREQFSLRKAGDWADATVPDPNLSVEHVYSTHIYTGTGTAMTITNGINLSDDGGLVWVKRLDATALHVWADTERGVNKYIQSNDSAANQTNANFVNAFNTNGFSVGNTDEVTDSGRLYSSFTFKETNKFFDIVAYTGSGSNRTVSHNLGAVPGMIIIKDLDGDVAWAVYHSGVDGSSPEDYYLVLNTTAARVDEATYFNDTAPTSSVFSLGTNSGVNGDGRSYIAYLFGHDTTSSGMIRCGSYTGNGNATGPEIDLGWQPQWVMIKGSSSSSRNWMVFDNILGIGAGTFDENDVLLAHSNGAGTDGNYITLNGDGFQPTSTDNHVNANTETYVYMAIRDSLMAEPTSVSDVFAIDAINASAPFFTSGFPVDLALVKSSGASENWAVYSRQLQNQKLILNDTTAIASDTKADFNYMTGFMSADFSGTTEYSWMWRKAKGYFDVVTYTGTGTSTTIPHNLGVVPEMIWVKNTDSASTEQGWFVQFGDETDYILLNSNAARVDDNTVWNDTAPTSSVFTVLSHSGTNESGRLFIAYLFASVDGISKIGTYTADGTETTVNCGFSNGFQFLMIKRLDDLGHWHTFNTTLGINSGDDGSTDDHSLNFNEANAAETDKNLIDSHSTGFTLPAHGTGQDLTNIDTATYLFYAIAAA